MNQNMKRVLLSTPLVLTLALWLYLGLKKRGASLLRCTEFTDGSEPDCELSDCCEDALDPILSCSEIFLNKNITLGWVKNLSPDQLSNACSSLISEHCGILNPKYNIFRYFQSDIEEYGVFGRCDSLTGLQTGMIVIGSFGILYSLIVACVFIRSMEEKRALLLENSETLEDSETHVGGDASLIAQVGLLSNMNHTNPRYNYETDSQNCEIIMPAPRAFGEN